jgi:hypothetical protein
MLAGIGAAVLLAACTPHTNTTAIKADDTVVALPYDQVIIPDELPCESKEEVVEGGIEAVELRDEVQVDGGIKAVEIPPEPMVAGGLRAEPIEAPPAVEEPVAAEEFELHTPPPSDPTPERHLRGRMAIDVDEALG